VRGASPGARAQSTSQPWVAFGDLAGTGTEFMVQGLQCPGAVRSGGTAKAAAYSLTFRCARPLRITLPYSYPT